MRPSLPRSQDEPVWYVAQSPQRLKRWIWISSARASAWTTTFSPSQKRPTPRTVANPAIGSASRRGRAVSARAGLRGAGAQGGDGEDAAAAGDQPSLVHAGAGVQDPEVVALFDLDLDRIERARRSGITVRREDDRDRGARIPDRFLSLN